MIVFWTQGMTSFACLNLVAYCFKFAKMAGINQGCMPCIFSVTIFYVSVLFFFKFGERISTAKLIGTMLMIPCIVFISLGGSEKASPEEEEVYTSEEMQRFAVISVSFALIAPIIWTIMAYYIRVSEKHYNYDLFDLAVDAQVYQNVLATLIYLVITFREGFEGKLLLEGSLTAIFFLIGDICRTLAYKDGPGGPINALTNTSAIY